MDIEHEPDLLAYLWRKQLIAPGAKVATRVLRGGVSNRAVLVEHQHGAWVLKQALEKLRVEADWFSSPERIHREAAGIRWLGRFTPAGSITPLIFEDHEDHILGMEAVQDAAETWKPVLLRGEVFPSRVRQVATLLACIHREGTNRPDIEAEFADRSFFLSLRIEPYYLYSAAQVPETAAFIESLVRDTDERRLTLVHGDYSPKNILICPDRVVLLDHEVIHFGDPAFDLGFMMAHLLSKAHHLFEQRAALVEAARLFWVVYQKELGLVSFAAELEAFTVRHTLACLLARVAGRSPLEYLSDSERARQLSAILGLLDEPPPRIELLIGAFVREISLARY